VRRGSRGLIEVGAIVEVLLAGLAACASGSASSASTLKRSPSGRNIVHRRSRFWTT
jgi:hypothetical protein